MTYEIANALYGLIFVSVIGIALLALLVFYLADAIANRRLDRRDRYDYRGRRSR